jgi:hypothetical protein
MVQQGGCILLDEELDPVPIGAAEEIPEPAKLRR